jgi:Tfp pilus assembly PilM family ATPase/Tfp pilus assembly protein PilN
VRRTGIDISPTRCVVVDAELVGKGKHGEAKTLRVHRFASLPRADSAQALTAELKVLAEREGFTRSAWVNVWDLSSSHQYVQLRESSQSELEAVARHQGASLLGLDDEVATVATAIGATRGQAGHEKTEVSFFAASSIEVRERLGPIIEAGFSIAGVTTPCGALWAQARFRKPALRGDVHAHVALGASMSALGIFSDGFLLYARDLNWGYAASSIGGTMILEREDLAGRLAAELRRSFLYVKQYWEDDVSQVLLCGDMPEIRSLTAPLIERLGIEVETLDTLDGIEPGTLPEGFAEQAASLRLASTIAVEPSPANLLPVEISSERAVNTGLRIFAAGSAAAVALAAFLTAEASSTLKVAERVTPLLEQQRSILRPRVAGAAAQQSAAEAEQQAALENLEIQGPRMSRMLGALADATPDGMQIRAVRAVPDGVTWTLTIEAFAGGGSRSSARDTADAFLRRLRESPLFGVPVRTPVLRTSDGSTGISVVVDYAVPR